MVVIVFRSRLKPESGAEFQQWAGSDFYLDYRVQVCSVQRDAAFP